MSQSGDIVADSGRRGFLRYCFAVVWHRVRRARISRLSTQPTLRVIFFDFDRTLTVVHVFKCLAGWADKQVCTLPALGTMVRPYALTERGQLCRLCELGPAWIEQAFGGAPRVAVLRSLLAGLAAEPGCRAVLVTRGYVAVARKCLREAGLLASFARVFGNVGSAYGEGNDYDRASAALLQPLREADEALLGSEEDRLVDAKWQIILQYKQESNLTFGQVVLVDDDPDEIGSVSHAAKTVHVQGDAGLAAGDVRQLLEATGLAGEDWARPCLERWAAVRDPLASKPPAIIIFNRKHLQVRLNRHLACLEDEFAACSTALRRIKMLLKSPLLLYSVAQHEFVQHMSLAGGDASFSLKAMQLVSLGMKSMGFPESPGGDGMPKLGSHQDFAAWQRGASTGSYGESLDGSAEAQQRPAATGGEEALPALQRLNSSSLHLYQEPATRSSSRMQSKMLGSVVSLLQQALLGLCPITMATAGQRRNVLCCHHAGELPAEAAVWSRYHKAAPLGAGHFGEVFRALEVCSGKEVAVKQLEVLEGEGEEENGNSEVHTLRALAHPNLLRVYEVVQGKDWIHIVSELAPGGTLSSYLYKNGVGGWISGAMQQTVSAVAYCHRLHVLHGDLKPENVLVSGARPDGSPLCIVCDFGHATVCIGSAQVAAPGDPRYIPPEVVKEEGLSPKSDIYMLGVTAFELLTGGWLPFFNDRAVTLRTSYYKLKFGGVREEILSEKGIGWQDLERLRSAAMPYAQEVVIAMLAPKAPARPAALEVLRSEWLQAARGPCKSAYDAMLRADAGSGWGLWVPQHPRFAERLRGRSAMSWTCRMLLGLLGSGLAPERVHGARLLFRRIDEAGEGTLTLPRFRVAAQRVGLGVEEADALFKAGDLHDQQFMDFKNVVMLFLDLEAFTRDELLAELRSVLNRIRGPCLQHELLPGDPRGDGCRCHAGRRCRPTREVAVSIDDLQTLLCQRPDARLQRILEDFRALCGQGERELTPGLLLRVLQEDPFT